MVTEHTRPEHTRRGRRLRASFAALARLSRLGDVPVVVMLAWAGWLAVPWSFNGLAQARAAAAAAATPPPAPLASDTAPPPTALIPASTPSPVLGSVLGADPAPPAASVRGSSGAGGWWDVAVPASWAIPGTVLRDTPATAKADPLAEETRAKADPLAEETRANADPLAEETRAGVAGVDPVARERARIAGEVHDAAGHGLAAIAMQAGIALVTLDDDPEQARASLQAIRETSTTALAHLRAALDGIDPPAGDLPSLIDGVRAAGLPVDVEPADPAVPAHLRGAVYGIVRESLTNVLRHAGPTRASVRVASDPCAFVLEVADRGAGWTGAAEGRGLTGMRARVAEAGGHLAAGPREGGGFQVIARFPNPTP